MTLFDGFLHSIGFALHALSAGKVPAEEPSPPRPSFSQAVVQTLASIGTFGKAAAATIGGGVFWYLSYLVVLTLIALALNLLYAAFMNWVGPSPGAAVAFHLLAGGVNLLLVFCALPFILLFVKLRRRFKSVATAAFVMQETILLMVISTLAIALFASVNPKFAFLMLLAWLPSVVQLWSEERSLWSKFSFWCTRVALVLFVVLSTMRVAAWMPLLPGPFNKLQAKVAHSIEDFLNSLADERFQLVNEEYVADLEEFIDPDGKPRVCVSEIPRPDGTTLKRYFLTTRCSKDRRYDVATRPLTTEEKLALEHLISENRRLQKEKAESDKKERERNQASLVSPSPEPVPSPESSPEAPPTPTPTLPPQTLATAPPTLPLAIRPTLPPSTLATPPPLNPPHRDDDSEDDGVLPPRLKLSYRDDNGVRTATLQPGTPLKVRVEKLPPADGHESEQHTFTGKLADDVKQDGHTVLYKDTPVDGRIWRENGQVLLQLRTVVVAGREYALDTNAAQPQSKKDRILGAVKFAVVGAVAGAAVDGKDGAKKGGIAGAAVGTAYNFSVDKPVTFKLRSPAYVPLGEDIRWQSK